MKGKQWWSVLAVGQLCVWLCCYSGVSSENCNSLEGVAFANIIYDPPASAGDDTYPEGTVARTQCDNKYAVFPRASAERTCVDGSWSGPRSSCRHISRLCRRNDSLVEFYGRTCSTACLNRPGRACPRDQSCICDGVCGWSCLANENCTALTIENGHLLHYEVGDIILHGSFVEYDCNDGYEGVLSGRVECRRGNLLPEVPTCSPEVLKCLPPANLSGSYGVSTNGTNTRTPSTEGYRNGDALNVSIVCNDGYRIQFSQSTVSTSCQDGRWTVPWPTCEVLKCSPGVASFGRYSVSLDETSTFQTPSGDGYIQNVTLEVRVECDVGYRSQPRESAVSSTCRDGHWSEQWPTCVELARCSRQSEQTSGFTVLPLNVIATSLPSTSEEYHHGSVIEVTCSLGYTPKEQVRMVCNDGQWSEFWPTCEILKCWPPTTPTGLYSVPSSTYPYRGTPSAQGYTHGERFWVNIECNAGYRAQSTQSQYMWMSCQDGDWSRPWPTCVELARCSRQSGSIVQPLNNIASSLSGTDEEYRHGSEIEVTCPSGFLPEEPVRMRCSDGQWSESWPTCARQQIPCSVPEREGDISMKFFLNGEETRELHPLDSVPDGSFLVARCPDPGRARLLGDSRRQCDFGEWLGEAPRCESVAAAVLMRGLRSEVASNGTVVVFPINRPGSSWGNRLRVFCRNQMWSWSQPVITASSGTTSQGQGDITLNSPTWNNSGNFTCTLDGSSHTVEVLFNELYCPEPVIDHGRVVKSFEWIPGRYPIMQRITFECDDEHRLTPSQVYTAYHTCVLGRWSDEIPRCEPYLCPEPVVPSNGRIHVVTSSRRLIGARLEFFCNSGYNLVGLSNERECESNAQWSDDFPTCEAEPVRPPSPCESVTCEDSWKRCRVLYSGEAACTCINPFDCPYEPDAGIICGTDGRNYTSVCQLKARACLLRLIVEVAADNAVCVYGLPEGEEVERINDYSNSESLSYSLSEF